MSIYFSGTLTRSGGISSAISKQVKLVNLKPVKNIQVQFDPFHKNAITAREFLSYMSSKRVLETNLNCLIKPNVVSDRSEPQITVQLLDKSNIKFLANNLTVLEILQQFNLHISSQVKEEEPTVQIATKTEKKKQKRK